MLSVRNGSIYFQIDRCCQCGACLAVCNAGAISATFEQNGLSRIHILHDRCTNCLKCVVVCPSHQLPHKKLSEGIWKKVKGTGFAWHKNSHVQRQASSGGAARALLSGCLSNNICDVVYTLIRNPNYPWAEGELIQEKLKLKQVASSMYLPVLVLKNLRPKEKIESIAIVGTTCQLLGASKLLKGHVDRILRIAILCKQQKHFGFTRYIMKRLGIKYFEPKMKVDYRGNGWPGLMTIGNRSLGWEQAAAIPFGKRLWRVPGCYFCTNPFGFKADITLADPWGLSSPATLGKTMAIAWTDVGRQLLLNTPCLKFESGINIADVKQSIGWPDLLRKSQLVSYRLGHKVNLPVRLSSWLESYQNAILERLLNAFRLPELIYKAIAHIPDPLRLIATTGDKK